MKPLRVDFPYPTVDGIMPDMRTAAIISPAYAGLESEYTAISQYIYHHFNFFRCDMEKYADLLEAIAMAEMSHFDLLGKTLVKLGVDPVLTAKPPMKCNFFNTSSIRYSTHPQKMLMDDITSELNAIKGYRHMLTLLCNEQVEAIIERIIMDEEYHVKILTEMLNEIVNEERKPHKDVYPV